MGCTQLTSPTTERNMCQHNTPVTKKKRNLIRVAKEHTQADMEIIIKIEEGNKINMMILFSTKTNKEKNYVKTFNNTELVKEKNATKPTKNIQ